MVNGMLLGERDELITAIVRATADEADVAPEDLPPIAAEIDIEALERFLQSSQGGASAEFAYQDWRIRVSDSGRIAVRRLGEAYGPYVGRCTTCGDELRDVDLETAQDFFAAHADRAHAAEVVRGSGASEGTPGRRDALESRRSTGTD